MKPTTQLHEARKVRFPDVFGRFQRKSLGCDEAAEILGVSVRTFYRMRKKFDEFGMDGITDHRIGKMSAKRVPVDEVMRILSLYETKYPDFTVKHFHEKLQKHGIPYSYTFVKKKLQEAGIVRKNKMRSQHRTKRPRKPLPGMMLHQDASRHEWVKGFMWDLIVVLDDATSEIYSAFFCKEEGTTSSFRGFLETFAKKGLPCSIYVDRGSHYFYTPKEGGKVSKTQLTQVGRAMQRLGVEMIAAYSPQARGRSERIFNTLQHRLPQELRINGIKTMEEANRFLTETFIPECNSLFMREPEGTGTAFTKVSMSVLKKELCIQEKRQVSNDNTIQYSKRIIQIKESKTRYSFAKCEVTVHDYPDGKLEVYYGPHRLRIKELTKGNKEDDRQDEFIAYYPISGEESERGNVHVPPYTEIGCRHGARVALQRSPIPHPTSSLSA